MAVIRGGATLLAITGALMTSAPCAQSYPTKPIRIMTGAIGGGADFTARLVAQGLSSALGQAVIVDNRPSIAGTEIASKAPPDGYTLLATGNSVWTRPLLSNASWNAEKDFAPIAMIERVPYVLAVNPSLQATSVKELIAFAKSKPGHLNFASGGAGSSTHLAMEIFLSLADVKLVHVPYQGNAPAISALITGEVQVATYDVGLVAPHAKSGKLRALAVTSAQPSPLAPGLPTVAAAGVTGYDAIGTTNIWAPFNTPAAIITRVNQEVVRHVNRPDIKDRFLNGGVEVVGSSPLELAAYIRADIERINKLIKEGRVKPAT